MVGGAQVTCRAAGTVRTGCTGHKGLESLLGGPSKQLRKWLQALSSLGTRIFSLLETRGLTQGLQPDLIPACCFLSWNQQCSLQWFAAALFLAPQGRDTY